MVRLPLPARLVASVAGARRDVPPLRVTRALDDATVRSLSFDEAAFPEAFTRVVGKPRSGHCAVFPVVGGERVIALVYADNGPSNRAIEELDILELAAAQAGLALENELLRRHSSPR